MKHHKVREYHVDGVHTPIDLRCCYYCGSPADTIDHVPPRAIRNLMTNNRDAFGMYKFVEVDCCKECNRALGKKGWTLKERRQHIVCWFRKRYRTILLMPTWSEKELDSVSDAIRGRILASLRFRNIIRRRLRWASLRDGYTLKPIEVPKSTQYRIRKSRHTAHPITPAISGLWVRHATTKQYYWISLTKRCFSSKRQ